MKRGIVLCIALALSTALSYGQEFMNWQKIGRGLEAASVQLELFDSQQSISAVRCKMNKHALMVVSDPAELADSTSAMAAKAGAVAAINGSYFNVKALTPTTFIKEGGVVEGQNLDEEMFRVDGMVCFRGKHIDFMRVGKNDCIQKAQAYDYAMSSGPLLILDGKTARETWPGSSFYTKRHPRTLIGTTKDGWVYLVVIDGRFPLGIGATIAETVEIARMMGLENALNLDGGGSSTIWTREGGVLNHPYDNRKYDHYGQRIVPNIVVVK